MIRSFGTDAMWTAAAILLVELMRMAAALTPRAHRARRWLRVTSILLATTVVLGLALVVLDGANASRVVRLAVAVAYLGVDIAALPCLLIGTTLLIWGTRPPGSPRRRHRRPIAVPAAR